MISEAGFLLNGPNSAKLLCQHLRLSTFLSTVEVRQTNHIFKHLTESGPKPEWKSRTWEVWIQFWALHAGLLLGRRSMHKWGFAKQNPSALQMELSLNVVVGQVSQLAMRAPCNRAPPGQTWPPMDSAWEPRYCHLPFQVKVHRNRVWLSKMVV